MPVDVPMGHLLLLREPGRADQTMSELMGNHSEQLPKCKRVGHRPLAQFFTEAMAQSECAEPQARARAC